MKHLTIADIITAAAPAVLAILNREDEYILEPVFSVGNGYATYLKDMLSGNKIPIVWHQNDEIRFATDTEDDQEEFIATLLENAVWSMDELLKVSHPR